MRLTKREIAFLLFLVGVTIVIVLLVVRRDGGQVGVPTITSPT